MTDVAETKDKFTRKMVQATKTYTSKEDCLFYQSFLINCAYSTNTIGQLDMFYGKDNVLLGIVRTDDEGLPVEVD